MRQGRTGALATEEPYEGILHVRVRGGGPVGQAPVLPGAASYDSCVLRPWKRRNRNVSNRCFKASTMEEPGAKSDFCHCSLLLCPRCVGSTSDPSELS